MSDLSADQNPTPNNSFDAVNNGNQKQEDKKANPKKANEKVPVVPIAIIFISIIILTLAALKWHHEGRLFAKAEPKKTESEKSPYDTIATIVDTPMVAAIDTTVMDTAIAEKETKIEAPIKEKPVEKVAEQKPKEEPKKITDLFGKEIKEMPSSFEGYLTTMANPAVDYDTRFSYADNNINSYFTSNAIAIQVDEKGNEINKMSVDEFLGVLRVNEFKIKIKDKQQSGGRIAVLKFSYQF